MSGRGEERRGEEKEGFLGSWVGVRAVCKEEGVFVGLIVGVLSLDGMGWDRCNYQGYVRYDTTTFN